MTHISMYQQYLILHIDLQLTIYPKLSVIFNTLSSNEFFMLKTLKDWMFTNTNYYKKIRKQTLKIQNETS